MSRVLRVAVPVLVCLAGFCVLASHTHGRQMTPAQDPSGHAPPSEREHTLVFAGDVMLSRSVGSLMKARNDWTYPFREITQTLRTADLAYCNLECPVSDQGRNQHHLYSFRADPRALEGLKQAGFRVVSQANNHAYDWGPAAVLDSVERLRAAGIRTVGAGQNDLEAHYPTLVDVGGLKVAFLAYVSIEPKEAIAGVDRPGVAWLDPARVVADIRFARPLADLLVVCPHWGVEYALRPTPEQVKLAHQMIDAGADLIVGSHPHVVQPLEPYHGRWIAYSLGNFVFDQMNSATRRGVLLKVKMRGKQIAEVIPTPIAINPEFQALLAPPALPSRPPREPRRGLDAKARPVEIEKKLSAVSHQPAASKN